VNASCKDIAQGGKKRDSVQGCRMKSFLLTLLFFVGAALSMPAKASTKWEAVGGWQITKYPEDGECSLSTIYEGNGATFIDIRYNPGTDSARFFISNKQWKSLQHKQKINISLDFGGGNLWSEVTATAIVDDDVMGLVAKFDGRDFLTDLSVGKYLHINKGDVYIDKLSLTGSAQAVIATMKCASSMNKGIPVDPFK